MSRTFTRGSADHDALWPLLHRPGRLTLRAKLDLWQMLRPAVQPGSTLDHSWPPEHVTLAVSSNCPVEVKAPTSLTVTPKEDEPVPLELVLTTGAAELELRLTYSTNEDPRPRAMPLRRVLLPWAPVKPAPAEVAELPPELRGGSWAQGRSIFFSEQAQCSKCHRVRGEGGQIGPDLSNLVHRDYASVLRDIRFPSAALNPDHLTYIVSLADGRLLTGTVRDAGGGRLTIGDLNGRETTVERADVESLRASPISTMPEGLDKALSAEQMRDLLTFLLQPPLEPAPIVRDGALPPRRRAEVEAVLKGAPPLPKPLRKLHIVLAAGPKDHGAGEHDYPLWQRRWLNLLGRAENVRVSAVQGWPSPEQWRSADLVVFYSSNPAWTAAKGPELDAFLARGGGLVYLHFALCGQKDPQALARRIGLSCQADRTRFRHGPVELTFAAHPITRNFGKVKFIDESYWEMIGDPKTVKVLATGMEEGAPQPLLWVRQVGRGRVFGCVLGHYTWTFDDPLFRVLVLRGLAWSAGEPVERFTPLATVGARIGE